jgi:hypothetical protein
VRFSGLIATTACFVALTALPRLGQAQMCTGDCNKVGVVRIDDLVKMVRIAQKTAMPSTCGAADPNGDGQVTVDEILTALGFALNGCPASDQPVLRLGSTSASPGMIGTFSASFATGGKQIDAVQNEIRFAAAAPIARLPSGDPDCTTTTGSLASTFLPVGCTDSTPCTAVRLTFARLLLPDGVVLYSCNVRVAASAAAGSQFPLTCANASYVTHDLVEKAVACMDGAVHVTE